jgi:glycosyltransferase involved in cell wall biosynthesis
MKIAYLSITSALGGAERSLLCLLAALRRLEPDWILNLIVPAPGPLSKAAEELGVDCVVVPVPTILLKIGDANINSGLRLAAPVARALPALLAYLRRLHQCLGILDPDLIHSNGFKMHVLGAFAKPARASLIWHMHDYISARRAMKPLLRLSLRKCAAIIANSASVALDLRECRLTSKPIYPIWNAIDLQHFSHVGATADMDALANLPPGAPGTIRIGLVATFAKWKGQKVFLEAISMLPPALQARAYVVGARLYDTEGSQFTLEDLRFTAADFGLTDQIGFTGFLTDSASAIRALDVVVHSSTEREPFGLVIAEAMACGRPVVVSNAGGAAEIASGVIGAFPHEPGSAAGLAVSIQKATEFRKHNHPWSPELRATAEAKFSPDRFASEIRAVYNEHLPRANYANPQYLQRKSLRRDRDPPRNAGQISRFYR